MTTKKVGEIFIAGGQPNITYNPRKTHRLEEQLLDYLDTGYKLLSVTGSTKSGKTVLSRKVIPLKKGIWVSGGQVQVEDDFWTIILDRLGIPWNYTEENQTGQSYGTDVSVDGEVSALVAKAKGQFKASRNSTSSNKVVHQYLRSPRTTAIDALIESKMPLIVDDFHYIHRDIQSKIVRALKDPIFEGLRVIIIAVPHRAYDAVRVESEMTGRVSQLQIPLWTDEELKEIPMRGFPELNAHCPNETIVQFVEESFGSPHLIQDFCLNLCFNNNLREASDSPVFIMEPGDYTNFFKLIAQSASKIAFERLAKGPRQRTDRVVREFTDGSKGDIYIAVLKALALTGPKTEIQYEEVRSALRSLLIGQVPNANEVTRVLKKMSDIAFEQRDQGEPVIEWVKDDVLYIADPFFAFYLKWNS
ncbi:hypothetical protein [Paenibacillus caui]|uniref:hypothetical protein n=1 Tax=Paenibacillus caui TaxID=2873927 RepID=UPI001CA8788C|nr:hypothetical protein [Paenibacillus caui]